MAHKSIYGKEIGAINDFFGKIYWFLQQDNYAQNKKDHDDKHNKIDRKIE